MSDRKILYRGWITEQGHGPDGRAHSAAPGDPDPGLDEREPRADSLPDLVDRAIALLDDDEREFIRRFYFMGLSYFELAVQMGRSGHRLDALHRRARTKIRRFLAPLAGAGCAETSTQSNCAICRSPHRTEIDQIIAARLPDSTWKPVIAALRDRFGLVIRSPQTIIGHQKYHARALRTDEGSIADGAGRSRHIGRVRHDG